MSTRGKGCLVWTILTEVATNTPEPPKIPSELIGVVLTALITGATAIIVAIVQRKKSPTSEATAIGGRPFAVPESEWIQVRDRSVETASGHRSLCERFDGHVRYSDETISEMQQDIANLKGQLGLK